MTIREILEDIKSDRVKDVILDCDAYNDIDDQYAIAFAAGSDKMRLLAVGAELFNNYRCDGFEDGMLKSYAEIEKELRLIGYDGTVKAKLGCPKPLTQLGEGEFDTSEASEFIISTALAANELLYVIVTGAATNIVSAIMKNPDIKEKICVVWVGCNDIGYDGSAGDFNAWQDADAARYLLNCGVPLVLLPALGPEGTGTQMLRGTQKTLDVIRGDSPAARYFRSELPELAYPGETEWTHRFWDIAGVGVIHNSSAFDLSVITSPRMRLDGAWAFEDGRHEIIYMNSLDAETVFADTFKCISRLV